MFLLEQFLLNIITKGPVFKHVIKHSPLLFISHQKVHAQGRALKVHFVSSILAGFAHIPVAMFASRLLDGYGLVDISLTRRQDLTEWEKMFLRHLPA